MNPETVEKICAVYRKYHLTTRQMLQLNGIIIAASQGQKILYVAPRAAGQQSIFNAAKEIGEILSNMPKIKFTKI